MAWLFSLTLFVSATLLFVVQPMFAKMVLPLLGGTPGVWNTCMVFYQAVLLGGYLYAHLSVRFLGPRRQALLHLVLLLVPWSVMPLSLAAGWSPPAEANPVGWLLILLAASIGLPFFAVSSSAPLLQAWFADTGHRWAKDPYFLYAASNLGSMLALLGYPTVVEPLMPLAAQTTAWTAGYGLLSGLVLLCALALWRSPRAAASSNAAAEAESAASTEPPRLRDRLRWVALAFVPSSLLLGVTAHISTDIAAVPLLWVVPLALYLLSFVLVFAKRPPLPHRWMVRVEPFLVILLASCFYLNEPKLIGLALVLHLCTFFIVAMVCHGELAARRPSAGWLTEFYLWMSVGGVIGGIFNGIVAPLVFSGVAEYPIALVLACLLRPASPAASGRWRRWLDLALPAALVVGMLAALETLSYWGQLPTSYQMALLGTGALICLGLAVRPVRFALAVLTLLVMASLLHTDHGKELLERRSFFGVVKVWFYQDRPTALGSHVMVHGSTRHGTQSLDPALRREPLTYYYRSGPLGQVFQAVGHRLHEVGVIGLGTGSIAAYGRPEMQMTFYEIDPVVVNIAEDPQWFTYLRDSRARLRIVLGDARLTLASASAGQFDLLVLDAFSSDSIPVHLITLQALRLYLSKLADEGVLAMHISNRYLDLAPILARLAEEEGLACRQQYDGATEEEAAAGKSSSHWLVMARRPAALAGLWDDARWEPVAIPAGTPLWSDDFSNILGALQLW